VSSAGTQPLEALAELEVRGWLVGGALRDRLLGRPTSDYDVALQGDPRAAARRLARRLGAHPFELSETFGAWRVVARDGAWNVDLLPLGAESIEGDLARRDLTINAIAEPLPEGELIDPLGGVDDLRARRLRMVSPEAFAQDPVRVLRLVRLACELGFEPEERTAVRAAESAPALEGVAAERVFTELKRIIASDRAGAGMRLLDELAITPVLLPELNALHGVEQSAYHHLDVYEHTLTVLAEAVELERDPERFLGPHADAVSRFLAQPLADELSRWQALRFGAVLHDIAKPRTRELTGEGRVTFIGHDAEGSELARSLLMRLRASDRLADHVAALTRNHLRLGFLVHQTPLSRRAVYRYLRDCAPVTIDVTVLSIADRLATRGSGSHLELAQDMLGEALDWVAHPPRPLIRGDELARALGLAPGPELGQILAELEEARFANEIASEPEAVARARELLRERTIGSRS
jgi:poly(A) polymerase